MSQHIEDRRVGIIEIPDLVPVLADAGYEVVTGDTVADAVKAIQQSFATGAFPIVVADSNTQGLDQWIMAVAAMEGGPDVSVLTEGETAEHIVHDNIVAVPLPFTLSQLAEEAALAPVDEHWAEVMWPAEDPEPEVEADHAVAPVLPGLPTFNEPEAPAVGESPSVSGDTSGQDADDTVWDATAAYRERLAAKREAIQTVDHAETAPAPQDHIDPPMPPQPVDYRSAPDAEDVYETGLDLATDQQPSAPYQQQTPPPPVAPQPVETASVAAHPTRRASRRDQVTQPVAAPPAHYDAAPAPQHPAVQHFDTPAAQQQPPAPQPVTSGPQRTPEYGQRALRKARTRTRQAPMVIASGAKGGIGKTTFARQLAITAAAHGYRTVLIDGDLGQANVPKFLKMDTSGFNVPTISDFALGNATLEEIVITSDIIDQLRPDNATPVPDRLSVVLAPSDDDLHVNEVTVQHYIQVIADVRERFDMVIFDGQIMKTTDEFMFTRSLIIPEIRDNKAFFLGLCDGSTSALKDLVDRVQHMVSHGVDRRRILVAMNNVPPNRSATMRIDKQLRQTVHGRIGIYIGIVNNDDQVWSRMIAGEPDLHNKQIDQVIYQTLFRATGYEKFDRQFDTETPEAVDHGPAPKKPGLLARLFGRA